VGEGGDYFLERLILLGLNPSSYLFDDISEVPPLAEEIKSSMLRHSTQVIGSLKDNLSESRLFHITGGYLGFGPPGVLTNDLVCVLHQCRWPVVLRKVNDHFVHVGAVFVLGLMDGEASKLVETGEVEIQEFEVH